MTVSPLPARWIPSPLGAMLAVAAERGLALLEWTDDDTERDAIARIESRLGRAITPVVPGANSHLDITHLDTIERELAAYFDRALDRFTVPVDPAGTEFQRRVWDRLLRIPKGSTTTYGDIARDIGADASAARAVGAAVGQNPIAIVIPCHRVIGASGGLTGFAGGLWRKRALLDLEEGAGLFDSLQDPAGTARAPRYTPAPS